VGNTPFVEEEKRDKFKLFLAKKFGSELSDKIREYIYPYVNSDKAQLDNNAILILKFDSYEEAKLAAIALNRLDIDKSHKAVVVTYMHYERNINMEDQFVPHNYFSFTELYKWEESNLTEMAMVKCSNKLFVGKIHYLKKEFQLIRKFDLAKQSDIKWSPQGTYLVFNEGNVNFNIFYF
jgi:hypothetical protein